MRLPTSTTPSGGSELTPQIDLTSLLRQFQALDAKHQVMISDLIQALAQKTDTVVIPLDLRPYLAPWKQHLANEGKSPYTIKAYSYHVCRLLDAFPSPSAIELDTFFTFLAPRVKSATLFQYVQALRSFFIYLAERGIPSVPADALPTPKYVATRRSAPAPEDVAKLLKYPKLSPRLRALLFILVDSGPRISEVLHLRRADVDLARLNITVLGKGRKERTIPISQTTAQAISDLLATHNSNFVFPGRMSLSWPAHRAGASIKTVCKRVGIPRITPHQFRHFFATQAINAGANIRSVSEILGHQTPSITLDVYCHTNSELNRQQHAAHSPLSRMLDRKEAE